MDPDAGVATGFDFLIESLLLSGRPGQADPALLVVVRQSLVLSLGLLLLLAAFLSRQSSSIHMWLEGSWWLVSTSMATILLITGIFQVVVDKGKASGSVTTLEILELCELGLYLILAVAANLARTRSGLAFVRCKTAFWVGTIVVVILWSISSLLSIVTSGRATPGTVITMAATVIVAVLMIADKLVVSWNHIDPSTVTEQEAERDMHEPLLAETEEQHARLMDALKDEDRQSLAERGGVITVSPYPERAGAPGHGTASDKHTSPETLRVDDLGFPI